MKVSILCTVSLAVAALAAAPAADAAESYDGCAGTIASLPATISTQGVWCLKSDLATALASGNAITVAENNVTIDCNGFKLGGLAAGTGTQAHGIAATNRNNVTIRGCNIRGFYRGVYIGGGSGHVVEDNRFDGNTYVGLRVDGSGSAVRRNTVVDTGGNTLATGEAYGIYVSDGVDVLDNTISGVTPSVGGLNAWGLITVDNDFRHIAFNRISGLVHHTSGLGYGIDDSLSFASIIEGNAIFGTPADNDVGIRCAGSSSTAVRNTVVESETGIQLCTLSGNSVNPN